MLINQNILMDIMLMTMMLYVLIVKYKKDKKYKHYVQVNLQTFIIKLLDNLNNFNKYILMINLIQ